MVYLFLFDVSYVFVFSGFLVMVVCIIEVSFDRILNVDCCICFGFMVVDLSLYYFLVFKDMDENGEISMFVVSDFDEFFFLVFGELLVFLIEFCWSIENFFIKFFKMFEYN